MQHVRPLPDFLADRYRNWQSTRSPEKRALSQRLSDEGQTPHALVISCCDSRVLASDFFDIDVGEFFIHRNIANLVPPYAPDGSLNGTSAAIEYAVTALKVPHIIVVGHSSCGGVAGCHAMCSGKAENLEKRSSFVGTWIETLRPGFERIDHTLSEADQLRALEHEAVKLSLENLTTFPFVADALAQNQLTLHGLWTNIADGSLHQLDAATGQFAPV